MKSGVAALVRLAVWAENSLRLEVLEIGRAVDDVECDCILSMTGKFLAYAIVLAEGKVQLFVAEMDRGEPPALLLKIDDDGKGWKVLARLLRRFEEDEIRSLQPRPIQLGDPHGGPDSWVIA